MEEDIKILEEMKANCIKGMMKGAIYTDEKAERKALAIENLIKGYKEKEADLYAANQSINDQLSIIKDLEEDLMLVYIKGVVDSNEYWKIQIKKKIEEIKNKFGSVNGWDSEFNYAIEVLQEFMEDK